MTRPHVTLKLATSLDGRIATASGESRWITGEAARAEVHRMRAARDAILVGIGTVLTDDPELLVRGEAARPIQPVRVVLDRKLRLLPTSRLVQTATDRRQRLVVMSTGGWPKDAGRNLMESGRSVEVDLIAPNSGEGEIAAVLRVLQQTHSIKRVMVEGGGIVAASFLKEGLVDRLEWFRAPIILGGDGKPAVAALALGSLAEASAWRRVAFRELGPDLWESYERVS
jgi:diaminohydroxyphosphoribosylaminopyrimidine deaminase/5-amino-6-(5-phosphoribosylamino)uracil reductase